VCRITTSNPRFSVLFSVWKCSFTCFKYKSLHNEKSGSKNYFQHDWSGNRWRKSAIHHNKYIILFLNKNNFSVTPALQLDGSSHLIGSIPISSSSELQHCKKNKDKRRSDFFFSQDYQIIIYKLIHIKILGPKEKCEKRNIQEPIFWRTYC